MKPEIARIAIELMKRVQLSGAEVEAYTAVMLALQEEAESAPELEVVNGE